jgi:2-polyprenyl-3-methyl-5-hydroxy-6-metoxy-1,4-benzoquinol methylase
MKLYNQVYGKLSRGAGSWINKKTYKLMINNDFKKKIIKSYKKQISIDLKRIKFKKLLKRLDIMDVGSGYQALAFKELGVKSVDHYDISKNNVKNFKNFLKKKNIKINSHHVDICSKNFNKHKTYNFIYLQGIIHHTKNPIKALKNVGNALRNSGVIWLYHYQPTSSLYFYIFILREIFKHKDLIELEKLLQNSNYDLKKINFVMDDLGCDYIHLFSSQFYEDLMTKLGFKNFYKKDYIKINKGVNYDINKPSCLTAYRKISNKKNIKKDKLPVKFNVFDFRNFVKIQQDKVRVINFIKQKIISFIRKKKLRNKEKFLLVKPLFDGYFSYNRTNKFLFKNVLKNFNKVIINLNNHEIH